MLSIGKLKYIQDHAARMSRRIVLFDEHIGQCDLCDTGVGSGSLQRDCSSLFSGCQHFTMGSDPFLQSFFFSLVKESGISLVLPFVISNEKFLYCTWTNKDQTT